MQIFGAGFANSYGSIRSLLQEFLSRLAYLETKFGEGITYISEFNLVIKCVIYIILCNKFDVFVISQTTFFKFYFLKAKILLILVFK